MVIRDEVLEYCVPTWTESATLLCRILDHCDMSEAAKIMVKREIMRMGQITDRHEETMQKDLKVMTQLKLQLEQIIATGHIVTERCECKMDKWCRICLKIGEL